MREKTLLKTAIGCSALGIIVLFFVSYNINIPEYKPSELSKEIGKDVKLEGKILSVQDRGDVIIISLNYQNDVAVVMFSKDNSTLKAGNNVEIFGEVAEYNQKPEIIAKKIRVIS